MDPQTIRSFLDIGVAGLLMVALVGGFRGWYVWKWQWERLVQDRDEWKAIAMRSLATTERVASVAEHAVKATIPDGP
jgi:hypothetical protein